MVSNVTSLTGNGLKDWLIQRVTAVYFAAYVIFVFAFLLLHPCLTYADWHGLFANCWFQIASTLAILNFSLHVWIGIWTVTTDYIKCTVMRLSVQMLVALLLLGQFVCAIKIIWGL